MKKIRNFNLSYVSRDAAQYVQGSWMKTMLWRRGTAGMMGMKIIPIYALFRKKRICRDCTEAMPFHFRDMTADWFPKWGRKKGRGSCLGSRM